MKQIWNHKTYIILGSILVLLLLTGTFFDYQISQAIFYPTSNIGILLASYGQIPAMLSFAIAGTLLIKFANKDNRLKYISSIVGGCACNLLSVMGITLDPMLYMEHMPIYISLLIAFCIVIFTDILIIKATSTADRSMVYKVIILLIGTVFIEMIFINLLKIPWGRPRMRMIAIQPEASFQPWWLIGSEMKQQLMGLGVAAEEFKSFPSGHSGNAACALLFTTLPLICPKLQGKEKLIFLIGFIFMISVVISRIVMGAHFLSDVTVGMSITIIVEVYMMHRIFKIR